MPQGDGDDRDTARPLPRPDTAAAQPHGLSRRSVLQRSVSAGTVALLPLVAVSCTSPLSPLPDSPLSAERMATLAAMAERIVPSDALGPGAIACGVPRYITRSLVEWNQADVPLLDAGLGALERNAQSRFGNSFTALSATQQDALLLDMEAGRLADFADVGETFSRIHRLVLEGMFSDPYYGGNMNYAGWDLIGYPGAVLASTVDMQRMGQRLPPLHTSAYGTEHDGH